MATPPPRSKNGELDGEVCVSRFIPENEYGESNAYLAHYLVPML